MINESASSGRIFLHYGSILIAVTSSQPFDWNPGSGILAPASKPRKGDSEFRLKSLQSAIAVETASPTEFPAAKPEEQLQEFRSAVLAKSSLVLNSQTNPSAQYVNRLGDKLECSYDGEDRINDKSVDYKTWPVSESPWTSRRTETDPLVVTDGTTERIYNFVAWTVTDRKK
jgi:hypothetical protein